ncbi:MAG: hypothetical protein KDA41_15940, partial [Planctomycetales bacterium]|nr:hypothetical protein [Planctomycetales bacterium]
MISALAVLYGLRQSFAASADLAAGWWLMGVICGYTLLLAGAALVIIRVCRVWDDARMILLVLVLLFLALSVSFDQIALADPLAGARFLLMGLAFSVAVTEALLLTAGMRLPLFYRAAYYGMLALLFAYPAALGWLSLHGQNQKLAWGVFLFPWLAAVAHLTLLPAARWGNRMRFGNGTPWSWPLYPWSLFVFLWIAFALRTYSLTYTFEAPAGMLASFQPHFLAPLVLAAGALLMEIGLAT